MADEKKDIFQILENVTLDSTYTKAFFIALKCDKDGNVTHAYINTCGMYSVEQDGEILLPCPKQEKSDTCYVLKKEFEDKYLLDYLVKKINETPDGETIKIPCCMESKKEDQFAELYGTDWTDGDLKVLFELREEFDKHFQNIAEDDFENFEKTHKSLQNLCETLYNLYYYTRTRNRQEDSEGKKSEIKTKGKRGYYLPEFYHIQCFGTGSSDCRGGYLEDTYHMVEELLNFNLGLKIDFPLSDQRNRFNRMADLAKRLGNRQKTILYHKWDQLFDAYTKQIAAKTFMDRLYPRFAYIGSQSNMPNFLKEISAYKTICETNETVDSFNKMYPKKDPSSTLTKDFDYIFSDIRLKYKQNDSYIKRICVDECSKGIKQFINDTTSCLLTYDNFLQLCAFDMSKTKDEYSFLIKNTAPNASWEWRTYGHRTCQNKSCHHHAPVQGYSLCWLSSKTAAVANRSTTRWPKNTYAPFCYDSQMSFILTNLCFFYSSKIKYLDQISKSDFNEIAKIKNKAQEDLDFNFSIIARAIRVFCENVMLALYKISYIPGFKSSCHEDNSPKGKGYKWTADKTYECYYCGGVVQQDRISSNAIRSKDRNGKVISAIDEAYDQRKNPDHVLTCRQDIVDLLDKVNPEMHASGNSIKFDEYEDILEKIERISKETLDLLKKNAEVIS